MILSTLDSSILKPVKEDPFSDLSDVFAELKRRADELGEQMRKATEVVSEKGLEMLKEILESAEGLAEETKGKTEQEEDI